MKRVMTTAPLIIISGPSGSGKSTVIRKLLSESKLPLRLSVSATTRFPRKGEVNGVHYHFWDRPTFEAEIQRGGFLEYALVHGQHYYGTLRREVEPYLKEGIGVFLDIDIQGYRQVREKIPDHLAIFLRAPEDNYRQRLLERGTEDAEAIERRLQTARQELLHASEYPIQIVNDSLTETVARLRTLLEEQFARRCSTCSTT